MMIMNPRQQITSVFDRNCISAIQEKRSSILSESVMIRWCFKMSTLISGGNEVFR